MFCGLLLKRFFLSMLFVNISDFGCRLPMAIARVRLTKVLNPYILCPEPLSQLCVSRYFHVWVFVRLA